MNAIIEPLIQDDLYRIGLVILYKGEENKVSPGLEPGLTDSKSVVLTATL